MWDKCVFSDPIVKYAFLADYSAINLTLFSRCFKCRLSKLSQILFSSPGSAVFWDASKTGSAFFGLFGVVLKNKVA